MVAPPGFEEEARLVHPRADAQERENPGMASSLPITAAKRSYGCPSGRVAPDRRRDEITGLRFHLFILNRKRIDICFRNTAESRPLSGNLRSTRPRLRRAPTKSYDGVASSACDEGERPLGLSIWGARLIQ
ncbi:hypothetical protein NL676_003454 [Syzygium grande]|nr:hypothetical protein NL676_003454 [Syzygium grande]